MACCLVSCLLFILLCLELVFIFERCNVKDDLQSLHLGIRKQKKTLFPGKDFYEADFSNSQ